MSACPKPDAAPSVLVVVAGGADAVPLLSTELLGLALARRVAHSAAQASFDRIVFVTEATSDVSALLAGTRAEVYASAGDARLEGRARIVVLGFDLLPDVRWLGELRERPLERDRLFCDDDLAAAIDASDAGRALALLVPDTSMQEPLAAMATALRLGALEPDPRGRIRVSDGPGSRGQAERWLLRRLVKDSESFMSRHVERKISLAISRRLVSSPVSPTGMTLLSIGVGLAGAPFFLSPDPLYQTLGALLFLAHSVLDGCDGELARLRFQQSRLGGLLDFWGDNAVHATVFFFMGLGWSGSSGSTWPVLVGAVASLTTLATAWIVYSSTMRERAGGGPMFTSVVRSTASPAARAVDALGKRDFIYLILACAAFGNASWFLVAAAVGTPVFLATLLGLARADATVRGTEPDQVGSA